jgi:hypothetical protein
MQVSQPVAAVASSRLARLFGALEQNAGAHVLLLIVLSLAVFPFRYGRMFGGLDGSYMRVIARDDWLWRGFGQTLGVNIFEGMGNSFIPQHINLIPAFLLQQLSGFSDPFPTLSYTFFAVELFLAAYLWGRITRLETPACLAGGWLLAVLALPLLKRAFLWPIYQIIPQVTDVLFFSVLFVFCLNEIAQQRGDQIRLFISGAAFIAIPIYLVSTNLILSVVFAPVIGATSLFLAAAAPTRPGKIICGALLAMVMLFLLAAGPTIFLYAESADTAASFFAKEMFSSNSLQATSILFQAPAFPAGPLLVVLGLVGIVPAYCQSCARRDFVAFQFFLIIGIIGVGAVHTLLSPHSTVPGATYLELALWPAYCAFTGSALVSAVSAVRAWWPESSRWKIHFALAERHVPLEVLAGMLLVGFLARPDVARSDYPPHETPIVARLRTEIGLKPGSLFRGYVATFTGAAGKTGPVGWLDEHSFDQLVLVPRLGNDHRFIGLWYFHIPTLNEYSEYARPELYAVESRLMTRPGDIEVRNVSTLTVPEIPVLRAFGVRFVITDHVLEGVGLELVTQAIPESEQTLRLYELPNSNLGTYSPTEVRTSTTASEILHTMLHIDFEKTSVTSDTITESLTPVKSSTMTVSSDGVHVQAQTTGVSLLVIPVNFSRCLTAKFSGSRPQSFSIHRVNLAETGLLFSGNLEVSLQLDERPIGFEHCRILDIDDAKSLQLDQIPPIGTTTKN